jgi:nucleoid DNA-binding protein
MTINRHELKKCILRKMDIHPNLIDEVLDNLALSVQEELAKGNEVK